MVFPILGSGDSSSGYDIENSCRFDDGDTAYLSDTNLGTATSTTIGTISFWFKLGNLVSSGIINNHSDSSNRIYLKLNSTGTIQIFGKLSGSANINLITTALHRDPSAWYHIVFAYDTTQGTDTNRMKLYVNGSQVTDFSTETYPAQDAIIRFNGEDNMNIGRRYDGAYKDPIDGYLAEFNFIDGLQLAPSNFGETDEDSGIWKPKKPDVSEYGTNGFFLEFKASAVGSGSASTIGADTSGKTNHIDSTNVAAADQATDTPTNNFATFNPLMTYTDIVSGTDTTFTWSEGNTKVSGGASSGTNWTPAVSSIGVSSGKWYYEFYNPTTDSGTEIGGAMNYDYNVGEHKDFDDAFIGIRASNGELYNISGSGSSVSNGTEWKDSGDILSVKLNMDDEEISFSTNGATYTSAVSIGGTAIASGTVHPVVYLADNEIVTVNFGNPNWALSSGNADANGYGNFEYAVPSGYYALCTKNLAEYG